MFYCVKCIYIKIYIETDIYVECQLEDHEKKIWRVRATPTFKKPKVVQLKK